MATRKAAFPGAKIPGSPTVASARARSMKPLSAQARARITLSTSADFYSHIDRRATHDLRIKLLAQQAPLPIRQRGSQASRGFAKSRFPRVRGLAEESFHTGGGAFLSRRGPVRPHLCSAHVYIYILLSLSFSISLASCVHGLHYTRSPFDAGGFSL